MDFMEFMLGPIIFVVGVVWAVTVDRVVRLRFYFIPISWIAILVGIVIAFSTHILSGIMLVVVAVPVFYVLAVVIGPKSTKKTSPQPHAGYYPQHPQTGYQAQQWPQQGYQQGQQQGYPQGQQAPYHDSQYGYTQETQQSQLGAPQWQQQLDQAYNQSRQQPPRRQQ